MVPPHINGDRTKTGEYLGTGMGLGREEGDWVMHPLQACLSVVQFYGGILSIEVPPSLMTLVV